MIGLAAAVLLALVGGVLLWQSSNEGESGAAGQAEVDTVQVLVAKRDIGAGESASRMADNAFAFVQLEAIPADMARPDALTTVEDLDSLAAARNVLATDLTLGVQLSVSDFLVPGTQEVSALPDVDQNLFEMTIALEPERALGGNVAVGQTVAVVGSFDPADDRAGETVVILESVVITNLQAEQLPTAQQLENDPLGATLAPTSRLFVTFGIEVEDLEKLTYASEFGRVWLARLLDEATIDGSQVRIRENVAVSLDPDAPAPDYSSNDSED